MNQFKILVANKKTWIKDIWKLSSNELSLVKDRIDELRINPWPTGLSVKKLKNYAVADFRLRVWDYRILFDRDLERREVVLFRILHRSKLY